MTKIKVRPRLAALLRERGMTQLELSEKTGIPQTTISRFLRSAQGRYDHLFAYARALGVKIEDLFEVEEGDGT